MSWLQWADAHPSRAYWLPVAVVLVLAMAWLARLLVVEPSHNVRRWNRWSGSLLLLLVLVVWRWPPLLGNREFNPDESQLIAGALTLREDAVFWRSVDGVTSGPVNFYFLSVLGTMGVPLSYFGVRLIGLLVIWGTLLAMYGTVRRFHRAGVAAVSLIPAVGFYATAIEADYLQYSTEYLPVMLMAFGLYWVSGEKSRSAQDRGSPAPLMLAGVCFGLLPWTKIQAAPLGAAGLLLASFVVMSQQARPLRARGRALLGLSAAALLPGILILGLTAANGQWDHFWQSYVVKNLAYSGEGALSVGQVIEQFGRAAWNQGAVFPAFLLSASLPMIAVVLSGRWRVTGFGWLPSLGFLATLVALLCVLAPMRGFIHYLLFMIVPCGLWSAGLLGEWVDRLFPTAKGRSAALAITILLMSAPFAVARILRPLPPLWGQLHHNVTEPPSEAAALLQDLRQPGDALAVWGWNSGLHVAARLPQGTRDAVAQRQIEEGELSSYFRDRYLDELRKNRPAFFVDAVGPGAFLYSERSLHGHESWRQLAEWIEGNYLLVADTGECRVYELRERRPAADRLP